MTNDVRGPSGAAPHPPDDLHARALPLFEIAAGTDFYRVHRSDRGPIFFGPGRDSPPIYRFDPQSGRFGILYAAIAPDAALIETLLRNPQRLGIDYSEIAGRSLAVLSASRDLRLVDARGANLSRLGTTAALATGPYGPCAAWADALFDHPERPDGILYTSRHNPDEACIALFEREDFAVSVRITTRLAKILPVIGALLDRHGKSLLGIPETGWM